LVRRLLSHPRMMNLPPLGPLATAGAPVQSTIVVIGPPALVVAALAIGLLAGVLCVAALRGRRASRRVAASPPARTPQVSMPMASAGGAR